MAAEPAANAPPEDPRMVAVQADLARYPTAKAYARAIPPPEWYTPEIEAVDRMLVYKVKTDLHKDLQSYVQRVWSNLVLSPEEILVELANIKYLLKIGGNPWEGNEPTLAQRLENPKPFDNRLLEPYIPVFVGLFELGPKLAKEAHPTISEDFTHMNPSTIHYICKKIIDSSFTYDNIFPLVLAFELDVFQSFPPVVQCDLLKAWATYITRTDYDRRHSLYTEYSFRPSLPDPYKKESSFLFSEQVPFEMLRDCFVPTFISNVHLDRNFLTGEYTPDVNLVIDCIEKFTERGENIGSYILRATPDWFTKFIEGTPHDPIVMTTMFDHMSLDDTLGFQQVYRYSGIREPITLLEFFLLFLPHTEEYRTKNVYPVFRAFLHSLLKKGVDPLMRLRPLELRGYYRKVYTLPAGATLFYASMRASNGDALGIFMESDTLPFEALLAALPEARGIGLLSDELAARVQAALESYPKLLAERQEAAAAKAAAEAEDAAATKASAALLEHEFHSNIDESKRTLFTVPSYVVELAHLLKGLEQEKKVSLLQKFLKKPHAMTQLQTLLLITQPLPVVHTMEHLKEYEPLVQLVKQGRFPPAGYTLPKRAKTLQPITMRIYLAEFPFRGAILSDFLTNQKEVNLADLFRGIELPFFSTLFISEEEGAAPPALELEAEDIQDIVLNISPEIFDLKIPPTEVSVFKYILWYAQTHPDTRMVDPKHFWLPLLKEIPVKHFNSPAFARYLLDLLSDVSTQLHKKFPFLLTKLYEVGFTISTPISEAEGAQSLFLSLFDYLYGKEGVLNIPMDFLATLVASPAFDFRQTNRDIARKATERPLSAYQNLVVHILKTGLWRGHDLESLSQLNEVLKSPFQVSMCPICLGIVPRSEGCMYMTHSCKAASPYYDEALYNKYRDAKGNVTWCNFCSRICFSEYYMADPGDGVMREMMRHYHLALVPDNAPRPGPAIAAAAAMADPFSVDCVQLGGGGIREKLIRLIARREAAERFQTEMYVAKKSYGDVQSAIIRTCWNAPYVPDGDAPEEQPAVDAFMQQIYAMLQPRIDALLADATFFPGFPEDRRRVTAYQRAGETAFSDEETTALLRIWADILNIPDESFPAQNVRLRQQEAYLGEVALNALRNVNVPRPRLPENAIQAAAAAPGAGAAALPAPPPVDPLAPILVPVPQPPGPPPPADGPPALECKTCFFDTKPRLWRFSHRLTLPPAAPGGPPQYGRGALHVHPETDYICDQCIRTALRTRIETAGQGVGNLGKCIQGCGAVLWPEELQPMINPPYAAPADGDDRPVLDAAFVDTYRRAFNLAMNRGLIQGGGTRRQRRYRNYKERKLSQRSRMTLRNSTLNMGKHEPKLSPVFFLNKDPTLHCAVDTNVNTGGNRRSRPTRRLKRRARTQ